MHHAHLHRRHFLQRAGSLGLLSALSAGLPRLEAQSADDYKALVCVFLFGGNDGNNMIIPADSSGYAEYNAVRGSSSGINIAQSALHLIQPRNSTRVFGLHPALDRLHPLFASGQLAILANAGPLNRPTTKADYLAGRDLPYQLFSHSDQQAQWQAANSRSITADGWGGRIADIIAPRQSGSLLPTVVSFAGTPKFNQGRSTSPLALPTSGGLQLTGTTGTDSASLARKQAITALLGEASDSILLQETARGLAQAIDLSGLVNPILNGSNSTIQPLFSGLNTSLANQLHQAAKLIAARASLGVKRQIFFVSLGGFDTHTNQLTGQENLLSQFDDAVAAFYQATQALGVADRVTTFTLTDFGRTFRAAAGGGTDHAWGNHHLILGGAVKGGRLYGQWPSLILGGPDDVSTLGRWLPTTSVDQYAATLARWFGLSEAEIDLVLPNLSAFPVRDLGFV